MRASDIFRRVGAPVALTLALLPSSAAAQAPVVPYDGHNPFNCTIQNTGTGVAYPDPGADPFCVEYDKTQQNVTALGLVEFASLEPARVLAAAGKCFYYQRDHWTASIVQGQQPEIYNWNGGYFFDKARAVGGAALTQFRLGGQAYDPRQLPFPPEFKAYFLADGGGGMVAWNGQQVDPSCVAKVDTPEEAARVYASPAQGGSQQDRCLPARGGIGGASLGPLRLRMTRSQVLHTLGAPVSERYGYQRYCLLEGGSLKVGYRSAAAASEAARVRLLFTTSTAYGFQGVHRRSTAVTLRRRVPSARPRLRLGRTLVYQTGRGNRRLLFGVRSGRVAFIALADPSQVRGRASARDYLVRATRPSVR